MTCFVYIVECADKSLYVGCTNNLEKRIKQDNESKWGARYTKIRRPVKLLYSETFDVLRKARQREIEIKGWRREKKLALIKTKATLPARRLVRRNLGEGGSFNEGGSAVFKEEKPLKSISGFSLLLEFFFLFFKLFLIDFSLGVAFLENIKRRFRAATS